MTPEETEQALRRLAEGLTELQKAAREASPQIQSGLRTLREFQIAVRQASPHIQSNLRTLRDFQSTVRKAWPSIQIRLRLTDWMLRQIEAAERNPRHKKARPWLALRSYTPRQIAEIVPYLALMLEGDLVVPNPKGRQTGARIKPSKDVERLAQRIAKTGERPTTAARHLLKEDGFRGEIKNAADSLVKALKRRDR